jgi:hypothetical protein
LETVIDTLLLLSYYVVLRVTSSTTEYVEIDVTKQNKIKRDRDATEKNYSSGQLNHHQQAHLSLLLRQISYKMVAFTVLRQAARASPTRLVAGMRVSLASSSACKVSKMSSNAMKVGVRAFSVSARRFGSGTSE